MRRVLLLGLVLGLALVRPELGAGKPGAPQTSAVTIAAAPNPVVFGGSTMITGTVTGKKASGAAVSLEDKPFP
ncbi:MAG: hypothetical protein QOH12_656, partial [Solirubrobacteraceae bacterium]|nr:hypothetical protein [Solirubrobacteraceae bacterium]